MYYINKIVGFLVSPIGGAIAGGIIAVVCARIGRKRMAKWVGGLTVAWLWLWATPIMTRFVGAPLEREFLVDGRVPAVESFPNADAIVVLGGSMGNEDALSPYAEMWTSADRVWQAARLWKAGKAPKIIATGDGAKKSTLGLLVEMGVKAECVEFMGARNTEEEARAIWDLLTQRSRDAEMQRDLEVGLGSGAASDASAQKNSAPLPLGTSALKNKKILLVTSAWHMKRARMMFEKYAEGVEVVCAPADFEMSMTAKKGAGVQGLLPDANALYLNSAALHEWVGLVGYRLFR